jgi:hypothetical protein
LTEAAVQSSKSKLRTQFFDYLFGEQEGLLCVATSHGVRPKFKQAFYRWPQQKAELASYIDLKVKEHNVWFCVNLLKESERIKENCLPSGLIWSDLDYVDIDSVSPPPTCILESSPSRYQAFWRLEKIIPADVAEEYSKRVAYAVGADKTGWPLTKLLRVPHTLNFKYENPPEVKVPRAVDIKVPVEVFDEVPVVRDQEATEDWELLTKGDDTPDVTTLEPASTIIYKYKNELHGESGFPYLFAQEPSEQDDWSAKLWRLINICAEAGMEREEIFSVAIEAKCNKYKRDNRPISGLWREVCKAHINQSKVALVKETTYTELVMPQLVDPDSITEDNFVKYYKEWGLAATDAPEEYHELACFIALSSLTSAGVKLELSWGSIAPNLWGLILGESTLTRKTTAMKMAMDIVHDLDEDLIVATDGSAEGLMTGLSHRPNMVSIFFKDEVSGFFDSINKKVYLAGMTEDLAKLYDVPKVLSRLLRKETITVASPYFIFFGGGIRDKVYSTIDESYILSGFMPRFLIVSGDNDLSRIRPTGPPTDDIWKLKQKVVSTFGELREYYNVSAEMKVGGQTMTIPSTVEAKVTDGGWKRLNDIEQLLVKKATESPFQMTALPTFQRLYFSMLKMSILIAITRRQPKDNNTIEINEEDINQAAWYIQRWGKHSVNLIANAGKADVEKVLDKIVGHVREQPGCTKSSIMLRWRLSGREMKELIETLEGRGLVVVSRKGKVTKFWPVT